MASLLYGSGLRLLECLRLRVKDFDFERHQITVREAKGDMDRVTMLPRSLHDRLKDHLVEITLCTKKMFVKDSERLTCHTRYRENTRTPKSDGNGSIFSQPRNAPLTRVQE